MMPTQLSKQAVESALDFDETIETIHNIVTQIPRTIVEITVRSYLEHVGLSPDEIEDGYQAIMEKVDVVAEGSTPISGKFWPDESTCTGCGGPDDHYPECLPESQGGTMPDVVTIEVGDRL